MRKSGNEGREKEGREDVDLKNGWEEKKNHPKRGVMLDSGRKKDEDRDGDRLTGKDSKRLQWIVEGRKVGKAGKGWRGRVKAGDERLNGALSADRERLSTSIITPFLF